MKTKWMSSMLVMAMAAGAGMSTRGVLAQGPPPPPPPGYQQGPPPGYGGGGWDVPPQQMQEMERRGFHDGIEGARKDAENNRPPNVNNRDEYRHPDVSRRDRRAYRRGFARGYRVGVSHLMRRGRY